MRKFLGIVFLMLISVSGYSQQKESFQVKGSNIFHKLDASITLGTTGVGIDLSSPIGNYLQLRAGYDFVPRFHYHMNFGVQVGDDPSKSDSKFQRLSGLLKDVTGFDVDNQIEMIGKPTMNNFKFLVDVFPLRNNKNFYITAGFYLGSSQIAEAVNATEDMPSLMAVSIYNNIYNKVANYEPIFEDNFLPYEVEERIRDYYGRMAIHIGDYSKDIYDSNGGLLHSKGDPYMMEPDENSMCKATVKVNSFKPYLGLGYGGRLFKNNNKYRVAVDCGLLFWGGTPSIITHDGTDLAKDVDNISGKVGDYVDILKRFRAYPVISVRFTKTIF